MLGGLESEENGNSFAMSKMLFQKRRELGSRGLGSLVIVWLPSRSVAVIVPRYDTAT